MFPRLSAGAESALEDLGDDGARPAPLFPSFPYDRVNFFIPARPALHQRHGLMAFHKVLVLPAVAAPSQARDRQGLRKILPTSSPGS